MFEISSASRITLVISAPKKAGSKAGLPPSGRRQDFAPHYLVGFYLAVQISPGAHEDTGAGMQGGGFDLQAVRAEAGIAADEDPLFAVDAGAEHQAVRVQTQHDSGEGQRTSGSDADGWIVIWHRGPDGHQGAASGTGFRIHHADQARVADAGIGGAVGNDLEAISLAELVAENAQMITLDERPGISE